MNEPGDILVLKFTPDLTEALCPVYLLRLHLQILSAFSSLKSFEWWFSWLRLCSHNGNVSLMLFIKAQHHRIIQVGKELPDHQAQPLNSFHSLCNRSFALHQHSIKARLQHEVSSVVLFYNRALQVLVQFKTYSRCWYDILK